jgi:hypothetical protein
LLEEAAFSPSCVFGALVKNQVGVAAWIHVWLFYSTGLHICFCTSITLFFYCLWLCIIVWSWVFWYLHHCPFCLVFSWLFSLLCFQTNFRADYSTLNGVVNAIGIWWKLHWTWRLLLVI